jgi:hypothetical protein
MAETSSHQALLRHVENKLSSSSQHVYTPGNITQLFDELRSEWTLPKGVTRDKFQQILIETKTLREIKFSATYDFSSKRYSYTGGSAVCSRKAEARIRMGDG